MFREEFICKKSSKKDQNAKISQLLHGLDKSFVLWIGAAVARFYNSQMKVPCISI